MTLNDKIEKIHKLNCEMFPKNSSLNPDAISRLVSQACEELGEINGAARSYFGRPYSPEKMASADHIAEEVGDCATMILLIGHLFCQPLEKSLDSVIAKLERLRVEKDGLPLYLKALEHEMPLKFPAADHQPFKYDVDDPINKNV